MSELVDAGVQQRFIDDWLQRWFDSGKPLDGDLVGAVAVLQIRSDVLLEAVFERITKLENEVRKAKSQARKSLDPAAFEIVPSDDPRTFIVKSGIGEQSFTVPVPIFQGPWKDGRDYARGDEVVWGGSTWIAMRDTGVRPDGDDSGWMIAARKGRDGKDMRG